MTAVSTGLSDPCLSATLAKISCVQQMIGASGFTDASPVIIPPALPAPAIPKKTVIGRVAGIELKHGFILCQMSTVNGVGLGDSLIVTRRGEYIGLVRVSRADKSGNIVYAELNAAQLVKGIQEGDQVVLKQ